MKFDGEICGGVLVENASDDFPQQKKLANLLPNFAGSSQPISPKTIANFTLEIAEPRTTVWKARFTEPWLSIVLNPRRPRRVNNFRPHFQTNILSSGGVFSNVLPITPFGGPFGIQNVKRQEGDMRNQMEKKDKEAEEDKLPRNAKHPPFKWVCGCLLGAFFLPNWVLKAYPPGGVRAMF